MRMIPFHGMITSACMTMMIMTMTTLPQSTDAMASNRMSTRSNRMTSATTTGTINDMIDEGADGNTISYDFVTQSIADLGWKNPDAAIGNPLKGFVSNPEFSGYNAAIASDVMDISIEAYYIGLDELMIGPATFDWEPLERRLNDAASRNRHVVLTIVCHYPNWHRLSVPQHVLDEGLELFYYPDFLGGGHSPNYGDVRLLNALQQFIAAFGEIYDGDPRIGFINLGLLGFWGEWHTFPHDWVPEHAKQSVVSWYRTAFRITKVLARYPHRDAYDAGFGLVDGSFTYETIDGEANGNVVGEHYFWPTVVRAGQSDFWKRSPMGGETRPEQQPNVFEPWYPRRTYQKQDFLECVSTTHATFMAHHDAFINDGYRDEKLVNALHAHARMGYNFMITKVGAIFQDSLSVSEDNLAQIDVTINQVGVAPFYYPLSLFLDCPDLTSPMEISGVESLLQEGDSKVLSFRNVPQTAKCMNEIQFHLNSTHHGFRNRPIKFAQGQHGIVKLLLPLPSLPTNEDKNEPYMIYNLINVKANVSESIVQVESGTSIDLAKVGRTVTIKADFYHGNTELMTENLKVEFRFNGRVHHEHRYPFLLAGHRGIKYARSLYLSTTGVKTIRTIVIDKRNESILYDRTIFLSVVDTTNATDTFTEVPVPAPLMTRSMGETFAKYLFVTKPPALSPVPALIPPSSMDVSDDNANEIHGFNTPSTPPLLVLEERRRRIEFRYHVTIPIAAIVVSILAMLSSFVHYRRWKRQRIHHSVDNPSISSAPDGMYKNPI